MDIYEDERTVSRADLAAWLRQVASQVEAGQVFYGAAGAVAVADQVHCELEIEQEGKDEYSIEIEFSWVNPAAEGEKPAAAEGEKADAEKAAATEADEEPETESSATA
ncbi:amphi-Trp domain-containing protein [Micromonospora craniellae]|uniref:Amphi-Trp domain-containing protein n=1 Tax=Micromonospora craniellae TaxID=2294034 RepID=A0A372G0M6_9ACTN|nr:amphi-Trp domain-containing protein [Micromonospora craniellae]QOC91391.1 amphi-Trp domain-containing protein [Micromonospora craniellae]RFS46280.1 amphi-Trp domain-containing protein [Micromonospora craniellae]